MFGRYMKKIDLSKTYRVRGEFVEDIKDKSLDFIIETKERIEEADVINALIYKHLNQLTAKDVTKYIEEIKKGN
ncbi:hypothetical protein F960_02726 [Acinetobacter gerneri DSM 14967 = CIP 107464 = MTCC 9824]|uniref:Uncharacterized protein n=2 Tax=Acinetobacter gerneri TaxID=202952 RepID=N8ZGZ1_9GAMM|nr:hypothetical protein F960_02726 [Acinetobacter gerneri DSM 14967 = CIP 107464 = MTCC 9824]